jgi:hypothetical protein
MRTCSLSASSRISLGSRLEGERVVHAATAAREHAAREQMKTLTARLAALESGDVARPHGVVHPT